ncbi:MAG: flagellar basal body rod protein FlgB [Epsilonproteobacteria bacterium]|nr:flagellar basal body rod protein FlgB [Campylobacterota bacterium]
MWELVDSLSKTANFYFERVKVIQGNIANADTPFYKPKDLIFSQQLKSELEKTQLKTTNPKHIDNVNEEKSSFKEVEIFNFRGYDGNRVDIQEELAKLGESSLMYKAMAESLKKEFSKLKLVISGR